MWYCYSLNLSHSLLPPEKAMAPHSSTLAWKIPWTEEPLSCTGEGNGNPLQCSCLENPRDRGAWLSMGSHRVGHDWSDLAAAAAPPPLCAQACSVCLRLHSCPVNRFTSTLFLDSIDKHSYVIFVFLFLTYFALYNVFIWPDSGFIWCKWPYPQSICWKESVVII